MLKRYLWSSAGLIVLIAAATAHADDPRWMSDGTCGYVDDDGNVQTVEDYNCGPDYYAWNNDGTCGVYAQSGRYKANVDDTSLCPQNQPAPQNTNPLMTVTISSVNGNYDPVHVRELYVAPGDVISLAADLFDGNGNAQGDSVEDFDWFSNVATPGRGTECDAQSSNNCLAYSDFETTNYGVNYYVPYSIGESAVITVRSHNSYAIDSSGSVSQDYIVLRNTQYGRVVAPTTVVVEASAYPYSTFSPDLALAGHGRWIWIGGVRYFAPYTYVVDGEPWMPYRHGYWTWTADGWTWVSYDPWGWMTDHYGVWRYHGVYGWVWVPFDDMHYEAHCVTWFYSGGYVGWAPYFPSYRNGYVHGYNEGFYDGYHEAFNQGYAAGFQAGMRDSRYNSGITIVQNTQVTNVNITNVTINKTTVNNTTIVNNVINTSVTNNTFARHPGGDQAGSRSFIERTSGPATVTQVNTVKTAGGAVIRQPQPVNPVPAQYKEIAGEHRVDAPVAVGTVHQISTSSPTAKPVTVSPTTNGKGITAPPAVKDATGKTVATLPPRTSAPAAANTSNPVAKASQAHAPAVSNSTPPALPKLDTSKPTPPPAAPKTSGAAPAPVVVPKPLPQPPKPPVVAHPPVVTPAPANNGGARPGNPAPAPGSTTPRPPVVVTPPSTTPRPPVVVTPPSTTPRPPVVVTPPPANNGGNRPGTPAPSNNGGNRPGTPAPSPGSTTPRPPAVTPAPGGHAGGNAGGRPGPSGPHH